MTRVFNVLSANQIIIKRQQKINLMEYAFYVLPYVKFVRLDQIKKQIKQTHILLQAQKTPFTPLDAFNKFYFNKFKSIHTYKQHNIVMKTAASTVQNSIIILIVLILKRFNQFQQISIITNILITLGQRKYFLTLNQMKNAFFQLEILIKDNELISFQIIAQISSIIEKLEIQFTIIDFSIFVTEQKQSITQISILFNYLFFQNNIISSYQENHFIIINCFNLTIQNVFITNTLNYRFLSLLSVSRIRIENVVCENSIQEQKCKFHLNVNGFIHKSLNNIQLKNIFTIDQSIISIQSNPFTMLNTNEYINIKNFMANGNILLKQQLGKLFSIIDIQSEKPQIIEIDNLIFQENIFHQYNKDPSETSASLFYVDSGQGLLMMKNIICFNNSLKNSSLSFISIFSNEVYLENLQVQNHNYHDQEFWIKYYNIQIQGNYNQNEIAYIISQSYNIETIGGALSIKVTKFQFSNGLFNFIKTQGSQVFNIELQGDGIVIIQNCSVNHAYNSLISNYEQDGAFTINGKKSLLAVYVNNITLTDTLNKITSSIFSIYPSSSQNSIELKNIFARDCFSLDDQIQNFKSNFQHILQSNVKIDNFTIISTEKAFLTFLKSIGQINLIERQKILTENALMNFEGCKLTLNQIIIEGIILSPIIKIIDSNNIKILNTKFINIYTFYPLNLVDVQQINVVSQKIHFSNITISNQFRFHLDKLSQNQINNYYIH
ncbi:unnamed protein product [Paramecium octaurelia]|uniref:Uncharacterized protein n=1 Tax=Paramecium octaurelia TaxID=43137 RepID=A0A8S1SJ97_PAROT|nr:unnamed protein product [Paramecium octaurelia]